MLTLKLDTPLDPTYDDLITIANSIIQLGYIHGELPFPWELIQGDEITPLEFRINELEAEESRLDDIVDEHERTIDTLKDDIDTLKDKLKDRDATIEELRTQLSALSD